MSSKIIFPFIKKTKNHCITCVNYIKYKCTDPYDEIYYTQTKIGKCSVFGTENLVTGEIVHENALICRNDENKCGYNGRYYNKNIDNS
jgi:hypothetical protein